MMVGPVPLIVIVEGVGLLFSILVWFTTTHEEPPKYRMVKDLLKPHVKGFHLCRVPHFDHLGFRHCR